MLTFILACDDECTGILLKELFEMKLQIDDLNVLDLPRLPWGYLNRISAEEQRLRVFLFLSLLYEFCFSVYYIVPLDLLESLLASCR